MGQPRPRHLYRYRSLNGSGLGWTRQIFEKNELYFPTIAERNDAFEGQYTVSFDAPYAVRVESIAAVLRNRGRSIQKAQLEARSILKSGYREYLPAHTYQKVRETILHHVPVLSLSEKNDDKLLWAHYGDGHKGICIEFDLEEDPGFFEDARRVSYQDEVPTLNFHLDTPRQQSEKCCLTKWSHWSYEKEWRIADFKNGPKKKPIAPEAISSVILGCRILQEHRDQVIGWVEGRPGKVKLYQAKQIDKSYRLNIEEFIP